MKKVCLVVLVVVVVFLFLLFKGDVVAGQKRVGLGTAKVEAATGERQKLVWKADLLRTQFLALGKKQKAQAKEIGKFLREMKEAGNISSSLYQDRVEKILETSRSFFWGTKETMRKKFSAMSEKNLRLEVQKLETEIQAMEDCLEYFAEEMALMADMFFDAGKPLLPPPTSSDLKIIRAGTPL